MNIQYIFIFNTNIILLKIKKTYKYTRDMYIYIKTADERFVFLKTREKKEEVRWWRNRTGRPLSPLQIHRKNIWTLSKLLETISDP